MRRIPVWVWVVGWAVGWAVPARAAGVWVTLAAGLPGASAPSSEAEVWFDSPHAPPYVAVTAVPGTVEAGTAGGSSFFGGLGVPVLLNLSDGSAYLTGGSTAPDAAKNRGPGGGSAGGRASAGPLTNADVPSTAALLGLTLGDPDDTGARGLTAGITDGAGNPLGTGSVVLPDGGWWVIGLGPQVDTPPPPPIDPPPPPPVDPPPVDPSPGPVDPVPTPTDPTGPVATPEPSTLALVAVGGVAAGVARRIRGRKSA